MYILRKVPDEDVYYNFEDYFASSIIIIIFGYDVE